MKIKVVFVLSSLEIGGSETLLLELIRGMDRHRFIPQVVAFPDDGALRPELEKLEVPVECLSFSGQRGRFHPWTYWQLFRLVWKLVRYFQREKPDLIQSYLFWANIYGSLAAKLAGIPVIVTGRQRLMTSRHLSFPDHWLQNLSNRWAAKIIANSYSTKQESVDRDPALSEEKICVIYNGIDHERYERPIDRPQKKRSLHLPEDIQVVGVLANLRPCKGLDMFLHAAAQIQLICPNTCFLLVGEDRGIQADLQKLAEQLGLLESVIFTGRRQDIPEILSIFDVQVSSSETESLSNALLEGMASGLPIVATQVGGTPELVEHGRTGFLVPRGDADSLSAAVIQLLQNDRLRFQMGSSGRQRIARCFGLEKMIAETESLYTLLLQRTV